jgi:hypothetical protein
MNLIRLMHISTVLMLLGIVAFFFRSSIGIMNSLITGIVALAFIGFLGWFVIDYAH